MRLCLTTSPLDVNRRGFNVSMKADSVEWRFEHCDLENLEFYSTVYLPRTYAKV